MKYLVLIFCVFLSCDHPNGFVADKDESFELYFGRGDGRLGLDTIKIKPNGDVELFRYNEIKKVIQVSMVHTPQEEFIKILQNGGNIVSLNDDIINYEVSFDWQSSKMKLTQESYKRVLSLIDECKIFEMREKYANPDIIDGTQWILMLDLGGSTKTIYFNNLFPEQAEIFAEELDEILIQNGLDDVDWTYKNFDYKRDHESKLWDSVK